MVYNTAGILGLLPSLQPTTSAHFSTSGVRLCAAASRSVSSAISSAGSLTTSTQRAAGTGTGCKGCSGRGCPTWLDNTRQVMPFMCKWCTNCWGISKSKSLTSKKLRFRRKPDGQCGKKSAPPARSATACPDQRWRAWSSSRKRESDFLRRCQISHDNPGSKNFAIGRPLEKPIKSRHRLL